MVETLTQLPETVEQSNIRIDLEKDLELIRVILELNEKRPLQPDRLGLEKNERRREEATNEVLDNWKKNRVFALGLLVTDAMNAIQSHKFEIVQQKVNEVLNLCSSEIILELDESIDLIIHKFIDAINSPDVHPLQRKFAVIMYQYLSKYQRIVAESYEPDFSFLTKELSAFREYFKQLHTEALRIQPVIDHKRQMMITILGYQMNPADAEKRDEIIRIQNNAIRNAEVGNFIPLYCLTLTDMYASNVTDEFEDGQMYLEQALLFVEGRLIVNQDQTYDESIARSKRYISDTHKSYRDEGFPAQAAYEIESILDLTCQLDGLYKLGGEANIDELQTLQTEVKQRINRLFQLGLKKQNQGYKLADRNTVIN